MCGPRRQVDMNGAISWNITGYSAKFRPHSSRACTSYRTRHQAPICDIHGGFSGVLYTMRNAKRHRGMSPPDAPTAVPEVKRSPGRPRKLLFATKTAFSCHHPTDFRRLRHRDSVKSAEIGLSPVFPPSESDRNTAAPERTA